ncbi:hypothetical protein ACFO5Q_03090 [Kordiimonas lipolytica]|uniref:Uncharacterized protein n=1 Tax=Kordiimonas lipolytica TaxID=1662421 RepID=A0ABV8U7U1_9PROT|nr:hypothetical protein [Kordiimonas lipolytica]
MEHHFHTFLHITLFGVWLGSIVALLVLLLCRYREMLSEPEGQLHLQNLAYVQRLPKAALILMLPMGLQLSNNLALITLGDGSMVGIWVFALLWLVIDWVGAPSGASVASKAMRVVERVLQAGFVLVLLGAGILSHLSGAPVEAPWLATKLILFAVALVIMSGVDALLVPLYQAEESKGGSNGPSRKQSILMAAGLLALLVALLLTAAWTGYTNWRG